MEEAFQKLKANIEEKYGKRVSFFICDIIFNHVILLKCLYIIPKIIGQTRLARGRGRRRSLPLLGFWNFIFFTSDGFEKNKK